MRLARRSARRDERPRGRTRGGRDRRGCRAVLAGGATDGTRGVAPHRRVARVACPVLRARLGPTGARWAERPRALRRGRGAGVRRRRRPQRSPGSGPRKGRRRDRRRWRPRRPGRPGRRQSGTRWMGRPRAPAAAHRRRSRRARSAARAADAHPRRTPVPGRGHHRRSFRTRRSGTAAATRRRAGSRPGDRARISRAPPFLAGGRGPDRARDRARQSVSRRGAHRRPVHRRRPRRLARTSAAGAGRRPDRAHRLRWRPGAPGLRPGRRS